MSLLPPGIAQLITQLGVLANLADDDIVLVVQFTLMAKIKPQQYSHHRRKNGDDDQK